MINIPDNPYRRRVMVVMPEEQYNVIKVEGSAPELFTDDEIAVVTYDHDALYKQEHPHPVLERLLSKDLFRPGMILVQDPFSPDNYRAQESALEDFSLRKHYLFTELCQILGAKEIDVKQVTVDDMEHKLRAQGSVGANIKGTSTGIEVETKRDLKDRLEARLGLKVMFSGGDPQLEEAEAFISKYRLHSDDNFVNLTRLRANSFNPIKSRTLKINMSSEVRRNLDIALRLDANKLFKGNATAALDSKVVSDVELELDVIF